MKKITTLCLVFLFVLSVNLLSQPAQKAILQVLNQQQLAWNAGDLPAFMEGYWQNDSLLFVGKSGPTYGWQNTLDNYRKNYDSKEKMGTLQFDILSIKKINRSTYFVLGKWHLSRIVGDAGGTFTLLFKRISGQWKITVDHSS